MPVEYRCEGVVYQQLNRPPKHGFCFTCSWIESIELMKERFRLHQKFGTMREWNEGTLRWGKP